MVSRNIPGLYSADYLLSKWPFKACIQRPDDVEPIWLEGNVSISRSPVAHLGDGVYSSQHAQFLLLSLSV